MFGRRNPIPLWERLRSLLWPKSGWRRQTAYVAHRLRRLPGSPGFIAAGFASGAAVSFTPFIGLHFVLAVALAVLVRGHLIAAAIGTAVGNPWSFPLIWAWIYTFGLWLIGGEGQANFPETLSMSYIFDNPLQILLPMTVGGIPTAVMVWFASYLPLRIIVENYQKARRRRLRRKIKKEQDSSAQETM